MGGKRITPDKIEKVKKLGNKTQLKNIEIAELVGVSDTTVGRVLSGYYDVNDTTADKDSPWYKKYKEVSNRSVYDVVCQLTAYELENEEVSN